MREQLSIQNFLALKNITIDVAKINLLIGPQATGKSIIARALYFFTSLGSIFDEAVTTDEGKRETTKKIRTRFESIFPRYSWDKTEFSLTYEVGNAYVSICGKLTSQDKTSLKVILGDQLSQDLRRYKIRVSKELQKIPNEEPSRIRFPYRRHALRAVKRELVETTCLAPLLRQSMFIPAGRAFFTQFKTNIFSILAADLGIDPLLIDFGERHEAAQRVFQHGFFEEDYPSVYNELTKAVERVLRGKYKHLKGEDWIDHRDLGMTRLTNASSGQQESLPMLLALCTFPFDKGGDNAMLFIEEPEAHLFPTTQATIVSLITTIHKEVGSRFFLTTHSPYVLSALNNAIAAHEWEGRNWPTDPAAKDRAFKKINGGGRTLPFEHIAAHTVDSGRIKNIKDDETKIVGAGMLDEVSDHFQNVLNSIVVGDWQ